MRIRKLGWYAVIVGAFNVELVIVAAHGLPSWAVWQWMMFPFAVLRLGRLLAFDGVMQPFRRPFAVTVPHWTGVGETTEGRADDNLRGAIGDLLACPICAGTHAGLVLLALTSFFPAYGTLLLYAMFGIGAAELLNSMLESFWWAGEQSRRQAGGGGAPFVAVLPNRDESEREVVYDYVAHR